MRVEVLTRNKPVFFQHVVEKKRTRMLEKYRIWQKSVIDKKTRKMRFDQKKWQYGFPGGYSRIVSCDVGRPGGYLISFLFFLFSGFRRRRFESFIGLCFACLGYESCCCSRLSQPFSKAKFRDDVGAIPDERTWLYIVELFLAMSEGLEAILFLSFSFFLVGSVGDVSRVLLACVLHALGTNPAAVRGFRNRFPKPNFEMMSARFQTSVPWL